MLGFNFKYLFDKIILWFQEMDLDLMKALITLWF
jgi:hypothetical protein